MNILIQEVVVFLWFYVGFFFFACLCTACMQCLRRSKEVSRLESRQCVLPYQCWELNQGSLEEQSGSLTAGLSLQPQALYFYIKL